MDTLAATAAFAALSQTTRLEAFRLLAQSGPQGLTAGAVAERLGVVASTLSHHLGLLERAGLVQARRQGRFVIYSVDREGARRLLDCLRTACAEAPARVAAAGPVLARSR